MPYRENMSPLPKVPSMWKRAGHLIRWYLYPLVCLLKVLWSRLLKHLALGLISVIILFLAILVALTPGIIILVVIMGPSKAWPLLAVEAPAWSLVFTLVVVCAISSALSDRSVQQ